MRSKILLSTCAIRATCVEPNALLKSSWSRIKEVRLSSTSASKKRSAILSCRVAGRRTDAGCSVFRCFGRHNLLQAPSTRSSEDHRANGRFLKPSISLLRLPLPFARFWQNLRASRHRERSDSTHRFTRWTNQGLTTCTLAKAKCSVDARSGSCRHEAEVQGKARFLADHSQCRSMWMSFPGLELLDLHGGDAGSQPRVGDQKRADQRMDRHDHYVCSLLS